MDLEVRAAEFLHDLTAHTARAARLVLYVDETVSMKVVRIIQGYVNVVNKMVWRKF